MRLITRQDITTMNAILLAELIRAGSLSFTEVEEILEAEGMVNKIVVISAALEAKDEEVREVL